MRLMTYINSVFFFLQGFHIQKDETQVTTSLLLVLLTDWLLSCIFNGDV
jgi:hypothetical protein